MGCRPDSGRPDSRPTAVERIATLRARTHDAIVDLDAVRSSDPAAREAMHAVRLTAHTLRSFWVPALDEFLDHHRPGERPPNAG